MAGREEGCPPPPAPDEESLDLYADILQHNAHGACPQPLPAAGNGTNKPTDPQSETLREIAELKAAFRQVKAETATMRADMLRIQQEKTELQQRHDNLEKGLSLLQEKDRQIVALQQSLAVMSVAPGQLPPTHLPPPPLLHLQPPPHILRIAALAQNSHNPPLLAVRRGSQEGPPPLLMAQPCTSPRLSFPEQPPTLTAELPVWQAEVQPRAASCPSSPVDEPPSLLPEPFLPPPPHPCSSQPAWRLIPLPDTHDYQVSIPLPPPLVMGDPRHQLWQRIHDQARHQDCDQRTKPLTDPFSGSVKVVNKSNTSTKNIWDILFQKNNIPVQKDAAASCANKNDPRLKKSKIFSRGSCDRPSPQSPTHGSMTEITDLAPSIPVSTAAGGAEVEQPKTLYIPQIPEALKRPPPGSRLPGLSLEIPSQPNPDSSTAGLSSDRPPGGSSKNADRKTRARSPAREASRLAAIEALKLRFPSRKKNKSCTTQSVSAPSSPRLLSKACPFMESDEYGGDSPQSDTERGPLYIDTSTSDDEVGSQQPKSLDSALNPWVSPSKQRGMPLPGRKHYRKRTFSTPSSSAPAGRPDKRAASGPLWDCRSSAVQHKAQCDSSGNMRAAQGTRCKIMARAVAKNYTSDSAVSDGYSTPVSGSDTTPVPSTTPASGGDTTLVSENDAGPVPIDSADPVPAGGLCSASSQPCDKPFVNAMKDSVCKTAVTDNETLVSKQPKSDITVLSNSASNFCSKSPPPGTSHTEPLSCEHIASGNVQGDLACASGPVNSKKVISVGRVKIKRITRVSDISATSESSKEVVDQSNVHEEDKSPGLLSDTELLQDPGNAPLSKSSFKDVSELPSKCARDVVHHTPPSHTQKVTRQTRSAKRLQMGSIPGANVCIDKSGGPPGEIADNSGRVELIDADAGAADTKGSPSMHPTRQAKNTVTSEESAREPEESPPDGVTTPTVSPKTRRRNLRECSQQVSDVDTSDSEEDSCPVVPNAKYSPALKALLKVAQMETARRCVETSKTCRKLSEFSEEESNEVLDLSMKMKSGSNPSVITARNDAADGDEKLKENQASLLRDEGAAPFCGISSSAHCKDTNKSLKVGTKGEDSSEKTNVCQYVKTGNDASEDAKSGTIKKKDYSHGTSKSSSRRSHHKSRHSSSNGHRNSSKHSSSKDHKHKRHPRKDDHQRNSERENKSHSSKGKSEKSKKLESKNDKAATKEPTQPTKSTNTEDGRNLRDGGSQNRVSSTTGELGDEKKKVGDDDHCLSRDLMGTKKQPISDQTKDRAVVAEKKKIQCVEVEGSKEAETVTGCDVSPGPGKESDTSSDKENTRLEGLQPVKSPQRPLPPSVSPVVRLGPKLDLNSHSPKKSSAVQNISLQLTKTEIKSMAASTVPKVMLGYRCDGVPGHATKPKSQRELVEQDVLIKKRCLKGFTIPKKRKVSETENITEGCQSSKCSRQDSVDVRRKEGTDVEKLLHHKIEDERSQGDKACMESDVWDSVFSESSGQHDNRKNDGDVSQGEKDTPVKTVPAKPSKENTDRNFFSAFGRDCLNGAALLDKVLSDLEQSDADDVALDAAFGMEGETKEEDPSQPSMAVELCSLLFSSTAAGNPPEKALEEPPCGTDRNVSSNSSKSNHNLPGSEANSSGFSLPVALMQKINKLSKSLKDPLPEQENRDDEEIINHPSLSKGAVSDGVRSISQGNVLLSKLAKRLPRPDPGLNDEERVLAYLSLHHRNMTERKEKRRKKNKKVNPPDGSPVCLHQKLRISDMMTISDPTPSPAVIVSASRSADTVAGRGRYVNGDRLIPSEPNGEEITETPISTVNLTNFDPAVLDDTRLTHILEDGSNLSSAALRKASFETQDGSSNDTLISNTLVVHSTDLTLCDLTISAFKQFETETLYSTEQTGRRVASKDQSLIAGVNSESSNSRTSQETTTEQDCDINSFTSQVSSEKTQSTLDDGSREKLGTDVLTKIQSSQVVSDVILETAVDLRLPRQDAEDADDVQRCVESAAAEKERLVPPSKPQQYVESVSSTTAKSGSCVSSDASVMEKNMLGAVKQPDSQTLDVVKQPDCQTLDVVKQPDSQTLDVVKQPDSQTLDVVKQPDSQTLDVVKQPDSQTLDVVKQPDSQTLDVVKEADCQTLDVTKQSDCQTLDVAMQPDYQKNDHVDGTKSSVDGGVADVNTGISSHGEKEAVSHKLSKSHEGGHYVTKTPWSDCVGEPGSVHAVSCHIDDHTPDMTGDAPREDTSTVTQGTQRDSNNLAKPETDETTKNKTRKLILEKVRDDSSKSKHPRLVPSCGVKCEDLVVMGRSATPGGHQGVRTDLIMGSTSNQNVAEFARPCDDAPKNSPGSSKLNGSTEKSEWMGVFGSDLEASFTGTDQGSDIDYDEIVDNRLQNIKATETCDESCTSQSKPLIVSECPAAEESRGKTETPCGAGEMPAGQERTAENETHSVPQRTNSTSRHSTSDEEGKFNINCDVNDVMYTDDDDSRPPSGNQKSEPLKDNQKSKLSAGSALGSGNIRKDVAAQKLTEIGPTSMANTADKNHTDGPESTTSIVGEKEKAPSKLSSVEPPDAKPKDAMKSNQKKDKSGGKCCVSRQVTSKTDITRVPPLVVIDDENYNSEEEENFTYMSDDEELDYQDITIISSGPSSPGNSHLSYGDESNNGDTESCVSGVAKQTAKEFFMDVAKALSSKECLERQEQLNTILSVGSSISVTEKAAVVKTEPGPDQIAQETSNETMPDITDLSSIHGNSNDTSIETIVENQSPEQSLVVAGAERVKPVPPAAQVVTDPFKDELDSTEGKQASEGSTIRDGPEFNLDEGPNVRPVVGAVSDQTSDIKPRDQSSGSHSCVQSSQCDITTTIPDAADMEKSAADHIGPGESNKISEIYATSDLSSKSQSADDGACSKMAAPCGMESEGFDMEHDLSVSDSSASENEDMGPPSRASTPKKSPPTSCASFSMVSDSLGKSSLVLPEAVDLQMAAEVVDCEVLEKSASVKEKETLDGSVSGSENDADVSDVTDTSHSMSRTSQQEVNTSQSGGTSHRGPYTTAHVSAGSQRETNTSHDVNASSQRETDTSHDVNTSSQRETDTSHDVSTSSQRETDTSHDENASSQRETDTFHDVSASSQKETNTSHDVNASSQRETDTSHDVNASSQRETDTFHDVNASSQRETYTSHDVSASSQRETDTSHDVNASSQRETDTSHNVSASSQRETDASHDVSASSQREADTSHDVNASSQREADTSHNVSGGSQSETDTSPTMSGNACSISVQEGSHSDESSVLNDSSSSHSVCSQNGDKSVESPHGEGSASSSEVGRGTTLTGIGSEEEEKMNAMLPPEAPISPTKKADILDLHIGEDAGMFSDDSHTYSPLKKKQRFDKNQNANSAKRKLVDLEDGEVSPSPIKKKARPAYSPPLSCGHVRKLRDAGNTSPRTPKSGRRLKDHSEERGGHDNRSRSPPGGRSGKDRYYSPRVARKSNQRNDDLRRKLGHQREDSHTGRKDRKSRSRSPQNSRSRSPDYQRSSRSCDRRRHSKSDASRKALASSERRSESPPSSPHPSPSTRRNRSRSPTPSKKHFQTLRERNSSRSRYHRSRHSESVERRTPEASEQSECESSRRSKSRKKSYSGSPRLHKSSSPGYHRHRSHSAEDTTPNSPHRKSRRRHNDSGHERGGDKHRDQNKYKDQDRCKDRDSHRDDSYKDCDRHRGDSYKDRDRHRDDSYKDRDRHRDDDCYKDRDRHRDDDSYKDRDRHRDDDCYKDRDRHRDDDSYKDRDRLRYDDSYKDRDRHGDVDSYKDRDRHRDADSYKDRDRHGDVDSYKDRDWHRDVDSYKDRDKHKDGDKYKDRDKHKDGDRYRDRCSEYKRHKNDERHSDKYRSPSPSCSDRSTKAGRDYKPAGHSSSFKSSHKRRR